MDRKLKSLKKGNKIIFNYPGKLFKLKRSKWKTIKTEMFRIKRRNARRFFKFDLTKVRYRYWAKVKKVYKEGVVLKNSVINFFGNTLSLKWFKRILLKKKNYHSLFKILIRPFYRVDILLWKLNFFPNLKESQQNIKNKNILVNGQKINKNIMLGEGDVVTILDNELKNAIKKHDNFLLENFLLPFCEIDFYSNTIIILKNYCDLGNGDLTLIFKDNINIKNFFYYLKKN